MGPELVTRDFWLKVTALGLAVLLWIVVRADTPASTSVKAPIEVMLEDPGWRLVGSPQPDTATVALNAHYRDLFRLAGQPARVVLSIQQVEDTIQTIDLENRMVRVGGASSNSVVEVRPFSVRLHFERVESVRLPVAVRVRGQLPAGVRLAGAITASPATVRVSGARSRLRGLDSVPTLPVDLGAATRGETVRVMVDTLAMRGFVVSPRYVSATIPATTQRDTLKPTPTQPDRLKSKPARPDTTHGTRGARADTAHGGPPSPAPAPRGAARG